ncbi:6-phosphogluconate phosphatase [uncultured Cedecea sp.]|uniref:6-phosphogluconate phosphatase n=1 Tax=uncultured Cedecea sp. TaxID=988762 RepID=UPI00261C438D|nr:6-phosphogluconate phosphatase [uncultured Cedecea sp.]
MSPVEAVFFDCDGTLVDSEVICSKAYVHMFAQYGIQMSLEEMFKTFKGVKLYEIIDTVCAQHGMTLSKLELETVFRQEVARLFDSELQEIEGANALLEKIHIPMCIVSNGPASKMHHSLGNTGLRHYFPDSVLYSGYDIQCWKPDPALMFHAADNMGVNAQRCILIDDSVAGAQSGIAAGMEVFYFCADAHNKPLSHPKVTTFTHLSQLPDLWRARGWDITR